MHTLYLQKRTASLKGLHISGGEEHARAVSTSEHMAEDRSHPDPRDIREKAFREMKKDVGMTTAQKSKEIRRMEMGSIFVLYIQPTIPTYTSGSFRL